MKARRPLEGLKVIDFTWLISGPIACKTLADHGAEVIKIETSSIPDNIRITTPFNANITGVNRSATFANYNSSKYSLTLNLRHPKASKIAERLVIWADVVVESFRPGTMKRWGLGYENLRKIKPEIIMLSMTMQGQTGPFSHVPGVGTQLQALVGVTHLTGWPDREPVGTPIPYPDFISPWYIVVAVMAALDYRRRTGQGVYIDISQLETSLQFMGVPLLDYTVNGKVQTRMGNQHPYAAPHGVYFCRGDNRWCAIAAFTDEEWRSLCEVMANPSWTKEPRFATFLSRKKNESELNTLVEEWTSMHTAEEVISLLQSAGVPAGVVQNGQDLLEHDSQLRHRHHFWAFDHHETGQHVTEMAPYRLSCSPGEPKWAAPCLGEHNHYICTQILGMSDAEFIELVTEGVLE
ncbi:MAG: CoA transferase [Chloroflexi bacterium]|nr:CoA transferase [Chloroflexota bacterium]